MWQSLPEFGTGVLYAILVSAAYTFAVAIAAGQGRPRLLQSARLGAYATSALIGLSVALLAYAFITHDFRIRYVAHYSDRSMTQTYLFTALWGGQDGSLLWWTFLLSLYITGCVWWLKGKYRQLQPYVIATLMVVVGFFAILMLFAANPFSTSIAGARVDGEGLNPLLQNYWMAIHPPALYTGFVGCSVPFAFAIAALVTGRLDNEWIVAVRKWMLFAWLFLSIGNALGMIWAYEELGWGGYWAWDPVENAACLPWFTASAYVHSTMIQERRNMLKVWNVFLICLTFILTIFGTFLTRSGLIASVHSFAQSSIGIFFVYFMVGVAAVCIALVIWRLPQLRGRSQIEAVASREAMFVVNNWALLGGMTFILVATLFPKISEWLWKESVTVGPPFFNRWMAPIGLLIFLLMGLAPLFGWRKTSAVSLKRAFAFPVATGVVVAVAHLALGGKIGFPAIVPNDQFYKGFVGVVLQKIGSAAPLITVALAAFNLGVIAQEFYRGVAARRRSSGKAGEMENPLTALIRLVDKSRRRYGGYIVHIGIVLMFLGFTGRAWTIDHEVSMAPGDTTDVGEYKLTYAGPRMEADPAKRMVFADMDVTRNGKEMGRVSPAKFIYTRSPNMPTTEVAMMRNFKDDLYVVVGMVSPQTKRATFQIHVNPLVNWIWAGLLVLIMGAGVSLWPELEEKRAGAWSYVRAATAGLSGIMFAVVLAVGPSTAHAAPRSQPPTTAAAVAPWEEPSPVESHELLSVGLALGLGVVVGSGVGWFRRKKP
ncbi:MAG: heme lyase CcmF/NrfE family subunit [Myxococcales bacterium]|nr:heme lyase CcmF/NrfE family subunit [Myxococcales bacterium]MCB9582174.1 heme lyase CcmF/NrfE family subunit [Polyangiaceae bacterium]